MKTLKKMEVTVMHQQGDRKVYLAQIVGYDAEFCFQRKFIENTDGRKCEPTPRRFRKSTFRICEGIYEQSNGKCCSYFAAFPTRGEIVEVDRKELVSAVEEFGRTPEEFDQMWKHTRGSTNFSDSLIFRDR